MNSVNHNDTDLESARFDRSREANNRIPHTRSKNPPSISDKAGQICFLCMKDREGRTFTLPVPCLKPSAYRRQAGWSNVFSNPTPFYDQVPCWERACESDGDVWRRLVKTWYQNQGWWKEWIPFFGIKEVEEVSFQFIGEPDRNGRYAIHMESVEMDEMKAQCKEKIGRLPQGPVDINDTCLDEIMHSSDCFIGMEHWDQPCIRDEADKAHERLMRLPLQYMLSECASKPELADGLFTFEGFAQKDYIYDIRGSNCVNLPQPLKRHWRSSQLHGLYFVQGWQTARMARQLPTRAAWSWFLISIIWLVVLLVRQESGDWNISLGVAQVVASCIAIIVAYCNK